MLYGIIIQMISYIFCLLASTCPISHFILIICFLLNVKLGGAVSSLIAMNAVFTLFKF
jgi:hypothetical protein